MKTGEQYQKTIWPLLRACLIGCGCGVLFCSLLLLLISIGIASLDQIPEAMLQPLTVIAAAAGSFFAGFLSARILKHMGLIAGASAALLFLLVVMAVSLAFPSESCSPASAITKSCTILLSGALGGVVFVGKKKKIPRR